MKGLVQAAIGGSTAAIARLLSLSETAGEVSHRTQEFIFPYTGKAHITGITGPPGVGKSTLISKLAAHLPASGQKVAIIACDPSSPGSGGALLGDRIRMHKLVLDERLFIRSLASRGSAGGLPLAAFRAADIFDACGFAHIILETVGTGQNQLDIMQVAHTVIAISAPGLGDEIQAMKSGLLEVADLHVVSKSDLSGSARALAEIKNAIHMRQPGAQPDEGHNTWVPMVLAVNSLDGEGIGELADAIRSHECFLNAGDQLQQRCRQMLQARIYREAIDLLRQSFRMAPEPHIVESIDQVIQRNLSPTRAAREMLRAANHDLAVKK